MEAEVSNLIPPELKKNHEHQEYVGQHIGKNSGRTYYLFLTTNNVLTAAVSAFTLDHDDVYAGSYGLERTNGTSRNPSLYLNLPDIPYGTSIFLSDIAINTQYRGDGLANSLFKALVEQLKKRGGVHVVTFNENSIKAKSKYADLGYVDTEVGDAERVPDVLSESLGWMYKQY